MKHFKDLGLGEQKALELVAREIAGRLSGPSAWHLTEKLRAGGEEALEALRDVIAEPRQNPVARGVAEVLFATFLGEVELRRSQKEREAMRSLQRGAPPHPKRNLRLIVLELQASLRAEMNSQGNLRFAPEFTDRIVTGDPNLLANLETVDYLGRTRKTRELAREAIKSLRVGQK